MLVSVDWISRTHSPTQSRNLEDTRLPTLQLRSLFTLTSRQFLIHWSCIIAKQEEYTHTCTCTLRSIDTRTLYIQLKAVEFYKLYNGRRYSSLEPTVCQLVYISRVRIEKSSTGLAEPGLVELPSCPVCLEKLVSPA